MVQTAEMYGGTADPAQRESPLYHRRSPYAVAMSTVNYREFQGPRKQWAGSRNHVPRVVELMVIVDLRSEGLDPEKYLVR